MYMMKTLVLIAISISLAACSSMRGNVIPQKGPTMEQIYDSMGANSSSNFPDESNNNANQKIRKKIAIDANSTKLSVIASSKVTSTQFHKLKNPELKMYVFPHLAGQDQLPVPGYYTAFNVYERDYYALPEEQ